MRSHKTYFLLSFVLFSLFSLKAEEEIVVQLSSSSSLRPLYLDISSAGSFERSYLDQLEKVLNFDLSHNGYSYVAQKTAEHKAQIQRENHWKTFQRDKWQALHIPFVVKGKIEGQNLSISAFSCDTNKVSGLENIPLTGKLQEDRRKLHEVADAIQEVFFGAKGIARQRIIYTVRHSKGGKNGDGCTEMWEADYDGANAKLLSQESTLTVSPNYLPLKGQSCRYFVYVSYKIGQPKIFLSQTNDLTPKRVTLLKGNQFMPTLAPTKDKLAFVSDINGNPEIFLHSFDPQKGFFGQSHQITSFPKGVQASPSFSPDGKRLAFVSNKDGSPRIYVMPVPAPGTILNAQAKPLLISKKNRDNTCPAWSPDGKKIAYSALTKGARQIWVYDFTTGQETQLTDGYGHKENPAWAPDSLHLLFNSATPQSSELFLINLHQKETVKITSGPGEKRFPTWEP